MVVNTIDMLQWSDKKLTTCLILLLLELFLDGEFSEFVCIRINGWIVNNFSCQTGAQSATSKAEIDRHLELGRDLLAKGQLADALTHYHAAVGTFL